MTRCRAVGKKHVDLELMALLWNNIFFDKLKLILSLNTEKNFPNSIRIYVCKVLVCISGIYRHPRVLSEISSNYNAHCKNYKENSFSCLVSTCLFILSHISPAALNPSLPQTFTYRWKNLHLYETIIKHCCQLDDIYFKN